MNAEFPEITGTKMERYELLLKGIRNLVAEETNITANLGNICSALKYNLSNIFWAGFYFIHGKELLLGPFQGTVACTRIKISDGVCGKAVREKKTVIVDDVNKFPEHIACSPLSKSEIVVPVFNGFEISGVLDIDSDVYSCFDETDKFYLEQVCEIVSKFMKYSF